jgi:hypothetical protein
MFGKGLNHYISLKQYLILTKTILSFIKLLI